MCTVLSENLIEERVTDGQRQLDVTQVAWAVFSSQMTSQANAGGPVGVRTHPEVVESA